MMRLVDESGHQVGEVVGVLYEDGMVRFRVVGVNEWEYPDVDDDRLWQASNPWGPRPD